MLDSTVKGAVLLGFLCGIFVFVGHLLLLSLSYNSFDILEVARSGAIAGGLHACTGPDHFAAIIPTTMGKHWIYGLMNGMIWGLGHGLTASIIGAVGFYLKVATLDWLLETQQLLDITMSVTFLIIGIFGLKEVHSLMEDAEGNSPDSPCSLNSLNSPNENDFSRTSDNDMKMDIEEHNINNVNSNTVVINQNGIGYRNTNTNTSGSTTNGIPLDTTNKYQSKSKSISKSKHDVLIFSTLFLNGCVLGTAVDGYASLMPALTVDNTHSATAFLISHCLGTMAVMGILSALLSYGSTILASETETQQIVPWRIAYVSSLLSLAIGLFRAGDIIIHDTLMSNRISASTILFCFILWGIYYFSFRELRSTVANSHSSSSSGSSGSSSSSGIGSGSGSGSNMGIGTRLFRSKSITSSSSSLKGIYTV